MDKKDYKLEFMSVEEAYSGKGRYPYAILYCYSGVKLCETSEVSDKDLEECREARFFGPFGELHVLPEEGRAIDVTETGATAVLDKEYYLSKKFGAGKWNQVKIRQYLEADEDGQMAIVLTRLMSLK